MFDIPPIVNEYIADVLDVPVLSVGGDTSLDSLDSLDKFELKLAIEEVLNTDLDDASWYNLNKVQDIYNIIYSCNYKVG